MKTPWHEYMEVSRYELWAPGICERFTELNTYFHFSIKQSLE